MSYTGKIFEWYINLFFSDAPIWVRWESGKNLTAGAGVYPDHPLLSFVDPNPWSLLGVGFSSGGTCEGNWAIDMNIGKIYNT